MSSPVTCQHFANECTQYSIVKRSGQSEKQIAPGAEESQCVQSMAYATTNHWTCLASRSQNRACIVSH
jgi:hypothetical protein